MHDRLSIPDAEAFEDHAKQLESKVTGAVQQAFEAAETKGFGNVMDFGIVNLPFAGGAADLAGKATASIGTCNESISGFAAQVKLAGEDYHDNDAELAQAFDKFIQETE